MHNQAEVLRILKELDVDGFIEMLAENGDPIPTNKYIALMAIHKARCRRVDISEKLKQESREWLINAGCERF